VGETIALGGLSCLAYVGQTIALSGLSWLAKAKGGGLTDDKRRSSVPPPFGKRALVHVKETRMRREKCAARRLRESVETMVVAGGDPRIIAIRACLSGFRPAAVEGQ